MNAGTCVRGELVGEGLGEVQLRVVIGRRGVLGEPRGGFFSALVLELLEVQLARAEVPLPGDFLAAGLLLAVLLPILQDEPQQEVVTEPRCPGVAREQSALRRCGVE